MLRGPATSVACSVASSVTCTSQCSSPTYHAAPRYPLRRGLHHPGLPSSCFSVMCTLQHMPRTSVACRTQNPVQVFPTHLAALPSVVQTKSHCITYHMPLASLVVRVPPLSRIIQHDDSQSSLCAKRNVSPPAPHIMCLPWPCLCPSHHAMNHFLLVSPAAAAPALWQVWEAMQAAGVAPDTGTYLALARMEGLRGDPDAALQWVSTVLLCAARACVYFSCVSVSLQQSCERWCVL